MSFKMLSVRQELNDDMECLFSSARGKAGDCRVPAGKFCERAQVPGASLFSQAGCRPDISSKVAMRSSRCRLIILWKQLRQVQDGEVNRAKATTGRCQALVRNLGIQHLQNQSELWPYSGPWSCSLSCDPGEVELKWVGDMDTFRLYAGLAVQLESDGHKAEQGQSLVKSRFKSWAFSHR